MAQADRQGAEGEQGDPRGLGDEQDLAANLATSEGRGVYIDVPQVAQQLRCLSGGDGCAAAVRVDDPDPDLDA